MRILGIDPGSRIMGWGMVEVLSHEERLDAWGEIRPKGKDMSDRLGQIYTQLSEVISAHHPEVVVLESVFVGLNVQSALRLGYARGVALAVAGGYGIPVAEYAPTVIKKSLTGHGHATKEDMGSMMERLFGVSLPPDTVDALAAALCHGRHLPFLHRLSAGGSYAP